MTAGKARIGFKIEQAQFHYVATLEAPIFDVFGSGVAISAAIYQGLAPYRVKLEDIKFDGASTNPGDVQASCYLLALGVVIRYRLDRVEVWSDRPELLAEEGLGELVERVMSITRQVGKSANVTTHAFSVGVHGQLAEGTMQSQLERFVRATPEGTPPFLPSGVSFACQRPGGEGEGAVVLERSAILPGMAFIRITSVHPGKLPERQAFQVAWRFFDETADRLGLEIGVGS